MGRPRLPTADKIARGNPGKRALNSREPDPEYLDDLTPASWLSAAAKEVWSEYAPKMRKAKVLTVIDVEPFARWCELVVRYRAVKADLERQGVMVPRDGEHGAAAGGHTSGGQASGGEKPRPSHVVNQLVFVESMLQKQLLAVEREFGMTPAARTRVQIEPQLTLFPTDDTGAAANHGKGKGSAYFTGQTAH